MKLILANMTERKSKSKKVPIKCVIFDIYDTLYDGAALLKRPSQFQPELNVLREAGYSFNSKQYEEAWNHLSKDWNKLRFKQRMSFISYHLQRYLGIKKPSWILARKMHLAYDYAFKDFGAEKSLSPNARKVLKWLAKRKYYLGIASDSNSLYGKKWLREIKLDKHFHHISISCEVGYEKTSPKPFELFLKKMRQKHKVKLLPEECLLVDDSQTACKNAQSIGMKVALYDPFRRKKVRISPDYHIHNLLQIRRILENK
ncbi:MAG: HAD family hydrolase [Candidatus Diapherotrites archaeon]